MNMTAFLRGVCVGMVAGAAADMAARPYPKAIKTAGAMALLGLGNALYWGRVTETSMVHFVIAYAGGGGKRPPPPLLCAKKPLFSGNSILTRPLFLL